MLISTRRSCSFATTEMRSDGFDLATMDETRNAAAAKMTRVLTELSRMDHRPDSNFFRHNIGRAIRAAKETIGFVIANDLLLPRIESKRSPQAVGSIDQMH